MLHALAALRRIEASYSIDNSKFERLPACMVEKIRSTTQRARKKPRTEVTKTAQHVALALVFPAKHAGWPPEVH